LGKRERLENVERHQRLIGQFASSGLASVNDLVTNPEDTFGSIFGEWLKIQETGLVDERLLKDRYLENFYYSLMFTDNFVLLFPEEYWGERWQQPEFIGKHCRVIAKTNVEFIGVGKQKQTTHTPRGTMEFDRLSLKVVCKDGAEYERTFNYGMTEDQENEERVRYKAKLTTIEPLWELRLNSHSTQNVSGRERAKSVVGVVFGF